MSALEIQLLLSAMLRLDHDYPAELERVIAQHPAVAIVAVGSLPDAFKGEVAKAYVVCRSGMSTTEEEILAHCREQLADYKLPRAVQFVDDLPKTSCGKILAAHASHSRTGCNAGRGVGRSASKYSERPRAGLLTGCGGLE